MVDLHSSREAGSAQGPPSATERRECKSRVTLLLRDADSGQIDHMAAEPTHGPHHPCTSSSRLGARGTLLAIANVSLNGGSTFGDIWCLFVSTSPAPPFSGGSSASGAPAEPGYLVGGPTSQKGPGDQPHPIRLLRRPPPRAQVFSQST